jgi:uncharacterized protein YggE
MDQHTHIHIEPPRILVYALTGTLVLLALFLFAQFVNAAQSFGYPANPIQDTITVTGTGIATTSPDLATISFTVQQNAATVSAAQTAATAQGNKAIDAMKALGIADADITTSSYTINPQYAPVRSTDVITPNGNSNTIVGYQVSESIEVKVRDTSKTGPVLQKLGDLGVQNVYGPNFGQADDSTSKDAARAAAIKDAKEKAQVLAEQLGVHLGKITNFSENGGAYPVAYDMKMQSASAGNMAAAAPPSLPTGTNSTSASVTITYAIR